MTVYIPLQLKNHCFQRGFRSKPLTFRRPSIVFVVNGTGIIFINQKSHFLKSGVTIILNPDDHVQFINDSSNEMELQLLHYQPFRFNAANQTFAAAEVPLDFTRCMPVISSSSLVDSFLTKIKTATGNDERQYQVKRQLYFSELILHLHSLIEIESSAIDDTISKTITYMEENYAKPISMSELPRMAGMTQSSYCRAFKKKTGMTPGQYLTKIRILKAKELMMDRKSTLRQIAVQVGYQDELYFSRIFKKTEGMSPSVYTQRKDKKIAIISKYLLQDHLLALGIEPIAAPAYPRYYDTPSGFPSYLHKRLQSTVPLNAERELSPSDVLSLSPDWIFKTEVSYSLAGRPLEPGGNTLLISHSTSWEQYLRDIAVRLDKKKTAERLIHKMTALEKKAQTTLAPLARQGTWAIVRLLPNDLRLYGVKDHAFTDLFYRRLQFKADDRLTHSYYESNALHKLGSLDPDNVLILWSEPREIEAIQVEEAWQQLKAVQNNRIFIPDSKEWDPWGPIGREYMIQSMVKFFQLS
ncbi:HTH-type transcriptional activator Btr [compost metagenome]